MIDIDSSPDFLWETARKIADETDSDILLLNSSLLRPVCSAIIETCIRRSKLGLQRKNIILILVTTGGDADVAYRIARCLQRKYEKVSVYVSGYCKSAGTLLALGGHELIISDHGELGPLDVQMRKQNSLFEHQSGLTVNASMTAIQERAFTAFERYFLHIEAASGGAITVDSAGKMASDMTVGLFAPLVGQLDPLHVGEATRAMNIALQYGNMLIAESANASEDDLDELIGGYPTHSFVIDRTEAKKIFRNVREPNDDETVLAAGLQSLSRVARSEDQIQGDRFEFINDTAEEVLDEESNEVTNEHTETNPDKEDSNDTQDGTPESTTSNDGSPGDQDTAEAGGDVQADDQVGDGDEITQLKSV